MIGRRDSTHLFVLESVVDGFGLDDLGLFGLFVESGKGEGLALVGNGD